MGECAFYLFIIIFHDFLGKVIGRELDTVISNCDIRLAKTTIFDILLLVLVFASDVLRLSF